MNPTYLRPRSIGSVAAALAATLGATMVYGCAATADSSRSVNSAPAVRPAGKPARGEPGVLARPTPELAARQAPGTANEPVATFVDARPAALIDGRAVPWGELRPILSDLAGAEAIREVALNRELAGAATDAGIEITEEDVDAEESRLLRTLSDDASTAIRLLDELRVRRNLSIARYRTLLYRNAILRALVADQVEITTAAVQQMYDATYGPRRQVRLLTVPDLATAHSVHRRVRSGMFLGDIAVDISTDESASRGGLLEPVSRLDPSYPATLRQAIWSLEGPGDVSDPTLLDNGYAIVQLVSESPARGAPPLADVQGEMEALVRLNRERLLMDQRARNLLAGTQVTIFDETLHESWRREQRR